MDGLGLLSDVVHLVLQSCGLLQSLVGLIFNPGDDLVEIFLLRLGVGIQADQLPVDLLKIGPR